MCFTKPVKYSYFYFATLPPVTWGKQTVTESILSRKTMRVCTNLWLPWWHMSHGECLPANPRAMQTSKRHKVSVRILCALTALKKIAILSFFFFHSKTDTILLQHPWKISIDFSEKWIRVITWAHLPGLCAVLDFLVCLFTYPTELQLCIWEATSTLVMKEAMYIV